MSIQTSDIQQGIWDIHGFPPLFVYEELINPPSVELVFDGYHAVLKANDLSEVDTALYMPVEDKAWENETVSKLLKFIKKDNSSVLIYWRPELRIPVPVLVAFCPAMRFIIINGIKPRDIGVQMSSEKMCIAKFPRHGLTILYSPKSFSELGPAGTNKDYRLALRRALEKMFGI